MKANVVEKTVSFPFCGKTYPLKATMNVEADIQENLGNIGEALSNNKSFRNLITMLTILLNEAVDIHNDQNEDQWEHLSERFVGRQISHDDAKHITDVIVQVFTGSRPEATDEDEAAPNLRA